MRCMQLFAGPTWRGVSDSDGTTLDEVSDKVRSPMTQGCHHAAWISLQCTLEALGGSPWNLTRTWRR